MLVLVPIWEYLIIIVYPTEMYRQTIPGTKIKSCCGRESRSSGPDRQTVIRALSAATTLICHPEEAAVDHDGNIFVANSSNNVMRRILKTVYVDTLV